MGIKRKWLQTNDKNLRRDKVKALLAWLTKEAPRCWHECCCSFWIVETVKGQNSSLRRGFSQRKAKTPAGTENGLPGRPHPKRDVKGGRRVFFGARDRKSTENKPSK